MMMMMDDGHSTKKRRPVTTTSTIKGRRRRRKISEEEEESHHRHDDYQTDSSSTVVVVKKERQSSCDDEEEYRPSVLDEEVEGGHGEEEYILPDDGGGYDDGGRFVPVPPLAPGEAITLTLHKDTMTIVEAKKVPDKSEPGVIMAGPTNPLSIKRSVALLPQKFTEEPLSLRCEWQECAFQSRVMDAFMDHVGSHVPVVEVVLGQNMLDMKVFLNCNWKNCPWRTHKTSEDLQRHLYLHAYHTKLKCIGQNTLNRAEGLNPCSADSGSRNILPDLVADLVCAWGSCREIFTNIQIYYNHIGEHVDDTPRGKNVPGGIKCMWTGCSSVFPNATKLRDHMKSHTQEKLLACPTCGGLFANRTRFFDHNRRQVLLEGESFTCDVCLKVFSTARLLREHIRSHINTYKCHLCEMSCSSPSALNTHMKYKHSDQRSYKCQFCDYAAKGYNDIVRHTKIHGNTTFKCAEEDCLFKCKSMTTLKAHFTKAHGNGKHYACHVCEKQFWKGYNLTKHLTRVHKLQWPAGHSRFRYKLNDDGFYRLLTVRYESVEEAS